MQRYQCLIYNGVLESFVLIRYELDIYVFVSLKLAVFCESDLRLSCLLEALEKLAEMNTFPS